METRSNRICETCNKAFYIRPSRIKIGKGRFCSKVCKDLWQKTLTGDKNANYKGGYIDGHGYHRKKVNGKDLMVHRLIMEDMIGRKLKLHERVHHINGNKLDNRPENLKLFSSTSEHIKAIHFEKCPNCGHLLRS